VILPPLVFLVISYNVGFLMGGGGGRGREGCLYGTTIGVNFFDKKGQEDISFRRIGFSLLFCLTVEKARRCTAVHCARLVGRPIGGNVMHRARAIKTGKGRDVL
jgi:hypothetical protein